jgi:hypothetical protein
VREWFNSIELFNVFLSVFATDFQPIPLEIGFYDGSPTGLEFWNKHSKSGFRRGVNPTCPADSMGNVWRLVSNTNRKHSFAAVVYLVGSRDIWLHLYPREESTPLKAFADASWGGEFAQSTYGVFITFLNAPVLWISRRQLAVAESTCHAEYMAVGTETRQTLWVRHLLKDVLKKDFIGNLFCDNQSAVHVATNDSSNKRTRNTDRDFYITNESLFQKKTMLTWVPTKDQLADIFTKSLGNDCFVKMREKVLGLT